jgi:zinc transporter ZupT
LTPYILQIAIGIHAVFEGLAIGIQTEVMACISISAAVICHKWAEGLTLGIIFYNIQNKKFYIYFFMNYFSIFTIFRAGFQTSKY